MKHDIKCWPQYFCRVADGSKTFEVRVNDRGYQPGDEVLLREWDPTELPVAPSIGSAGGGQPYGYAGAIRMVSKGYTGAQLSFRVGYVLPIDDKRVVFSLLPLERK